MTRWNEMTGAQRLAAVGELLKILGGSLLWLGVVLLISVPVLVAAFGTKALLIALAVLLAVGSIAWSVSQRR